MKMSKEAYNILTNDVINVMKLDIVPGVINSLKANTKIKNPYIAFIWQIYFYVTNRNTVLRDMINKENLFDKHIETAMKTIITKI
jgi:hypothetical protein